MDFFNLITGPGLLEPLEALLPEYRERKYPPTVILAMFLGQVLRADGSCQNAVNEACRLSAVERRGSGQCEHRRVLLGTATSADGDGPRTGATDRGPDE